MSERRQGFQGESILIKKSGEKFPALFSTCPVFSDRGKMTGTIGIAIDITDLKQAEESLRESESRYRSLFESANDAIMIIKDDVFMDCNWKTLEMFGHNREQIIGKPPYTFSPIDQPDGSVSREKALDKMKAAYEGEPQIFEWRHTKYDGTPFDAQVSLNVVVLSTGIHLQAIVRDISERKRLDKELRLMQRWVEQSVDFFFWVREDSRILYVNQAVCDSLGYTKEEFKSMKVGDFDLEITLEAWPGFTQKLRDQGSYCFETRLRKKNGQVFPVEITANILKFEGKDHFFAYGRDISAKARAEEKRKELENQIRQASKMEAIGTLAGGIAHDFNNILGAILGYAQLADMDIPENNKAHKYIKQILTASDRAKGLVGRILAFSRKSKLEKIPVDIGAIVKESLTLLRASLPANIEIHQNIASDLGTVLADQTQVHQIMMNLCTNAHHAMEKHGGQLEVVLAPVELSAEEATIFPDIKPGRYLRLTVTDSGYGMDSETVTRIFEPYFTTKELGEGTGLGLATVHGIVKGHGGAIRVYSEPGSGTSFHIFFPCVEGEANAEANTYEMLSIGTEQILFVDDEKVLVDIGEQMLKKLGYKVDSRTSPYEALEAFKATPSKYDVVITDMTMPKMSGENFSEEILKIRSDIPIIICTGFSNMMSPEKANATGIKDFLMKPLTMRELSKSIRHVLNQNQI